MSTFNGFQIVPLPATPAVKSLEFTANDYVGLATSPFTGQQQVQDWNSALLRAAVTLPPVSVSDGRQWIAFLLALRGSLNVFQLGDPSRTAPAGSASGTPLVDGASQSGFSLATKGWTHSASGVLLAGDQIQIGYRLHFITADVNADSSGKATVGIWPNLRESPADGATVITANTKGIWRLETNDRKWMVNPGKTFPSMQFNIREAI